MDGNTPNPNNPWALEAYYPQQTALATQEEQMKAYVQRVEEENHSLKQQMDHLKQTTHAKLLQMEQQFSDERQRWQFQFDQLQQRSSLENRQSTDKLRHELKGEIDSIRAQLARSHQETQQSQEENSRLRSSITQLQEENATLLRSQTEAYEGMRTFNSKHREVLADQDAKDQEIATLQTTIERLREDVLKSSSLNQAYLETISELKSTLQEVRAATTAPPDHQQTSTGSKEDSNDQQAMSDVQSQAGTSVISDFRSVDFHSPVQAPLMATYLGHTTPQQPTVHVNATGSFYKSNQ